MTAANLAFKFYPLAGGHVRTSDMADKMTEGIAVSVMGFIIVFVILLIIMGILSLFNLFSKFSSAASAKANVTETPAPAVAVPSANENLVDDTQLVAVITAAIAAARASEGEGGIEGTDGLFIKSIRRANAWNKDAWNQNNNF